MTAPAGDGPRTDTSGLREEIARDLGGVAWEIALPRHRDRLRAKADDILALPTIQRLAERAASLAREQAAEELLKAGGYFHDQGVRDELILGYLDRRAAALRGER